MLYCVTDAFTVVWFVSEFVAASSQRDLHEAAYFTLSPAGIVFEDAVLCHRRCHGRVDRFRDCDASSQRDIHEASALQTSFENCI